MSCRRARRELLGRFRFGEVLDESSDRHLAHLEACRDCRDEVGLDQALVAHLRRALRARVAGQALTRSSWEVVRSRALSESPPQSLTVQLTRFMRFVPAGAAMAVMVFAVVTSRGASAPQLAPDRNATMYQSPADAGEAWQMPWWLRDRPPAPPPAPTHGILILAVPDTELLPGPNLPSGPLE